MFANLAHAPQTTSGQKDDPLEKGGPLSGVSVLDLTDVTGQYCGRVLAELGADVVKIEPPGGDPVRRSGPFYLDRPDPEKSLLWQHYNFNKRGITLDLGTEKGRKVALRLAKGADILLETFAPGHLDELGMGWDVLNELNPGLILASIVPFGQTGPWKDYKSSDLVALAAGGLLYQCGWPDRAPVRPGGFQAFHMASLHAVTGALIALYHRTLTGKGQHVDVSVQESIPIAMMTTIPEFVASGTAKTRNGDSHDMPATGVFPCQDGFVDFRLRNQHWEEFLTWLNEHGAAGDLSDEKWKDPWVRARREGIEHIDSIFRPFLMRFTKSEIYYQGLKRGFEVGPVNNAGDVARDPQLIERDFFEEVEDSRFGKPLRLYRGPYRLSQTPPVARKPAPRIGEHNEEVYLKELGLGEDEYLNLKKIGAI